MADKQEKYFQISSTLDKYTRISKNTGNISENEIRVKSSKETKFYVGYALHMLEKSNSESITIKATGNAIPKAVNVVEILKRRVENLHQINRVRNVEVEDTYEPLEEGLDTVVVKRYLSLIEITLTKKLEAKQKQEPGYQEPLPPHELNTVHNQAFRTQVNVNINRSRGAYGSHSQPRQRISQPADHYRNEGSGPYPSHSRNDGRNFSANDRGYGASGGDYGHSSRQGFQTTRGRAPLQQSSNYHENYAQPQRGARRTRGGGDAGGGRRNYNSSNNQDYEYMPKAQPQPPRPRIGNFN